MPTFESISNYPTLFSKKSSQDINRASVNFGAQLACLFRPFSSMNYLGQSVAFPFVYFADALCNAAKAIIGVGLIIPYMFIDPLNTVPALIMSVGFEIGALAMNVLNLAVSLIQIATRTLMSMVNFILCGPFNESKTAVLEKECVPTVSL